MEYNISTFVSSLKDPRRGQGQRHSLKNILIIILMAILSKHQGLRGFARFAKSNEQELTDLLGLKHGVPCYYTFQVLFQSLNEQVLAQKFIEWMRNYHPILADEYVALDGKVIKSTVVSGITSAQNFTSIVTAFGHQSGMSYGMQSFENGKSGEIQALRDLVEQLGLTDKVFTMDALHSQKNI